MRTADIEAVLRGLTLPLIPNGEQSLRTLLFLSEEGKWRYDRVVWRFYEEET